MTLRNALVAALLVLVCLTGAVPPWRRALTFAQGGRVQTVDLGPAGYRPLFAPPPPLSEYDDTVKQSSQVDATRLLISWGCLLAAAGAAWLLVTPRRAAAA